MRKADDNGIFYIPETFGAGSDAPVFLQDYTAEKASFKNRVVFSKNMLCFIISGEKEAISAASAVKSGPENLLLFPAGTMLMTERTPVKGKYRSLLLFFSDDMLAGFCAKYDVCSPAKEPAAMRLCPKDDFLRNAEESLQILASISKPEALLRIKLEEILLYLFTRYPEPMRAFASGILQHQRHLVFRKVVEQHAGKGVTVDELAFLCNMSLSTFKRHFQETYGTSPKKFFIAEKMKLAKRLLQQGRTPSEIFSELGYGNLSGFSNEFKKFYGVSPVQLRIRPGRKKLPV